MRGLMKAPLPGLTHEMLLDLLPNLWPDPMMGRPQAHPASPRRSNGAPCRLDAPF